MDCKVVLNEVLINKLNSVYFDIKYHLNSNARPGEPAESYKFMDESDLNELLDIGQRIKQLAYKLENKYHAVTVEGVVCIRCNELKSLCCCKVTDMKTISQEDAEFIITVLNQVWHDSVLNLQRTNLGDIERKDYGYAASKSKELMDKLKF